MTDTTHYILFLSDEMIERLAARAQSERYDGHVNYVVERHDDHVNYVVERHDDHVNYVVERHDAQGVQ